jgi:kynurenine formamidase
MDYDSATDVPYITPQAMQMIVDLGVKHLLVDLPSVDKMDDPELQAHHIFWQSAQGETSKRTITELVYVPNHLADGTYLLNLMVPNIVLDAVPSKPILYPLH